MVDRARHSSRQGMASDLVATGRCVVDRQHWTLVGGLDLFRLQPQSSRMISTQVQRIAGILLQPPENF